MGKIHVLRSEISNKIAAGEVVERPASVVKELVENSIDAGADSVCVEIKNGGISYIRVTDNGSGMTAEDAKTAFLRHATSKIQTAEDLDSIYTLGFRGEALSSIGAVAKVQMYTRTQDGEGILTECEGGQIMSSKSAGTPVGTTFIVQNLFFNTPARMKFLKKDTTEAGYIHDIISRLILAHPEISFKFIDNGREKLFSPGDGSLVNAVYTVYGRDYARAMLKVDYDNGSGITVTGAAAKGEVSRPNRTFQSFFVNNRYVKSALIIRAVEEAYKNQVMIGKFPMAVLNIQINPSLIDINVHPTKLEVKFSNEKAVYEAVYFAVKNALYATANVVEIHRVSDKEDTQNTVLPEEEHRAEIPTAYGYKNDTAVVNNYSKNSDNVIVSEQAPIVPKNADNEKVQQSADDKVLAAVSDDKQSEKAVNDNTNVNNETKPQSAAENYFETLKQNMLNGKLPTFVNSGDSGVHEPKADISITQQSILDAVKDDDNDNGIEQTENTDSIKNDYTIIGQLFSTYILIQKGDELLICDQHAAHERIRYEQILKAVENSNPSAQMLISPSIVSLSASEYSVIMDNIDFFESAGFEIEEFGVNTVAVRTVPTVLSDGNVSDMIVEMVSQLAGSKREIITESRQRALYTAACRSAVKANHNMTMDEMKALIDSVFALENINTCPHGRPIIMSMSKKEIEKEFKRIV